MMEGGRYFPPLPDCGFGGIWATSFSFTLPFVFPPPFRLSLILCGCGRGVDASSEKKTKNKQKQRAIWFPTSLSFHRPLFFILTWAFFPPPTSDFF